MLRRNYYLDAAYGILILYTSHLRIRVRRINPLDLTYSIFNQKIFKTLTEIRCICYSDATHLIILLKTVFELIK